MPDLAQNLPPAEPAPALVKGLTLDAPAWSLIQLALSVAADHYEQRSIDLARQAAADAVHHAPHLTAVMDQTGGASESARELAAEFRQLGQLLNEKRANLARERRRAAVPTSPHAEAAAERIAASMPAEHPLIDLGQGDNRVRTYVCPQCHTGTATDPVSLCAACTAADPSARPSQCRRCKEADAVNGGLCFRCQLNLKA